MQGRIIKQISNDYTVEADKQYICKARGVFRSKKETPLVGDIVEFDPNKKIIEAIKPRLNELVRPAISNIDQAVIVTSVKEPDFQGNLLDKLLTIIEYNKIKPIICFTKLDLLTEEEKGKILKYIDYYQNLGYLVLTNEKKANFKNIFDNKITVFTGQSGAGKSSLLNLLDPKLELKTNEISYALGRGKHTTRHTELLKIESGLIADTPGFSAIDLSSLKPIEIRDNMLDMFKALEYCKYRDCMHIKEDGCAIKAQIETDPILNERYQNYLNFINKK
ncbi:MAG: ribosome small subunit-dependent GTPase A [Bacilli bacterium]|nr:ribosome small subunit-dependent GTPase A [Bacilli bacterium]